jgi:hypothetical protein
MAIAEWLMALKTGEDDATLAPGYLVQDNGVWHVAWPRLTDEFVNRLPPDPHLVDVRSYIEKRLSDLLPERRAGEEFHSTVVGVQLKALGKSIFKNLLPKSVQTNLKEAAARADPERAPVLRVHTQHDWIPWELMHDGTDFLGLRFQLARLPILPTKPPLLTDGLTVSVRDIYNLLGADVLNDDLKKRWEDTFAPSNGHRVCENEWRFPSQEVHGWPTLMQVAEALESEASILHITCHGEFSTASEHPELHLTLNRGARDSQRSIYALTKGIVADEIAEYISRDRPPLVFGNACESAGITDLTPGLGWTFFRYGAAAFIGTFAKVTPRLAVEFAARFYEELLIEHKPVGEALRGTKQWFHEREEPDPSWLFYCLYGSPDTRFD